MPATVRPCGTDILEQQWRKDASYLAREQAINNAILKKKYITAPGAASTVPTLVTLPVVFHIINQDPTAFPDVAIIQALKELNDAYATTGAFSGGRFDTKIQFCLAKTAPDGGKTTGIVRTHSYLEDFDNEMEGGNLTALGKWDGSRYINIWVVKDIKSEYMQAFECGVWTRLKMGGYASAGGDIVVAGLGVSLVAHEMGHYLSLLHTFGALDCKNNDCLVDGDKVCDTPPERTITGGYACSMPQNSCSTDTLSGFTTDVPDLPDNFMDYGQGTGCILGFTAGQAERMHNFIDVALTGMLASTVCNSPCPDNITASFTRSLDYPVVGDAVTFTSTSTGGNAYEWLVDGVSKGNTPTLLLTVTAKKNYEIILRVTNTVTGCHATANDMVPVSCGVVARFWPSKRKIAAKDGIELDSVLFNNRSRNATSWSWLMSNDKGMAEQEVSTVEQLKYIFKIPGIYHVRLAATDGHCFDTTNAVQITVDDATADGAVYVTKIECYQQTKVKVSLYFHNFGYHTIPKNTPIAFYDGDPRKAGTKRVGGIWPLPADLSGKCSSALYTATVDVGRAGIDTLAVVLNDNGTTLPLVLPNTGLEESAYGNNISIKNSFKFKVALTPADYTLTPQQQVVLKPVGANGNVQSAVWDASPYLDCTNCVNATFTAPYRKDTVATVRVMGYTQNACYDSTIATLHIPVVDDYTVTMKNVDCAKGDSLHIDFSLCNLYAKGNIPAQLSVDFFDRAPADPSAALLGTGFVTPMSSIGNCVAYGSYIKHTTTGNVFAIVNKDPTIHAPETGLNEANRANNTFVWNYVTPVLSVFPKDTVVFRKATFPLYYSISTFTPTDILWQNDIAYTLSCNKCAVPRASMLDSAFVGVQLTNKYGCVLKDQQYVRIFPPDFTIRLLQTNCYDNDHVLVKFSICTNNGYDSIHARLPVSFFNGDPANEKSQLLSPLFYTPVTAGVCQEFTHVVSAPRSNEIVAVVNSKNGFVIDETNYANNLGPAVYTPFTVSLDRSWIELPRPATVGLYSRVNGGRASAYAWTPQDGLSCFNCPNPLAAATSSMKYIVMATNEYYCTDTASVYIKTFTNFGVTMPNAFTPNGDGQNDWFYVIGSWDIKLLRDFTIFNRVGNKVFEAHNTPANDRSFGWDGNVKGAPAPMGTYVYFATVELLDGSTQLIKGAVTLIR
ncbi:gliding motility-associated-like protein [Chitinophaga niastensis]|uniref:Gliding motility-associated-like protein n=1 Tax=Chitinophaga niastensis TaxID=536980 RepID=A0A2P8HII7_CHINA|nr:gliding motility-associated C-terminal domain-containing protein [Chitinophaga niastensis]PSL46033.1 gliding motility-associated-like protein [Chitinophaga niastensis]